MAAKKKSAPLAQIPREKIRKIWQEGYKQTDTVLSTDSSLKTYVLAAIITNLVLIAAVTLLQSLLPPQVPLFYGAPEGEGQLASKWLLTLPSLLALVFVVINVGLGYTLENKFLRKSLTVASLAATVFSAITTVKIFLLITGI